MRNHTLIHTAVIAMLSLSAGGLVGIDWPAGGMAGALFGPRLAYAQEQEDPEVTNMAKQHFKLGQEAYAAGKYDVAIKELKKAYLLKRIPVILINIAMTYRKLKDYDMALYFYKKYVNEAPPDDKARPNIETAIAETEKEKAAAALPPPEPAKPAVELAKPAVSPAAPKPAAGVAAAPGPGQRAEAASGGGAGKTDKAAADQPATEWSHTPIDAVPPGQPIDVRVQMPVMKGVKVKVFYRKEGQANFETAELKRRGNEKVARLPASIAEGRTFQYYIEARDPAGTLVKSSASEASPNIVLIDPSARPQLAGAEQPEGPDDEELAKRARQTGPKRDIENEAVRYDINQNQQAMERLRAQLHSQDQGKEKKSALRAAGWAGVGLIGLGLAGLGSGIGLLATASNYADLVSADSRCDNAKHACPNYGTNTTGMKIPGSYYPNPPSSDFEQKGQLFNTVGIALAAVGGVALAGGGALLVYDLVKKRQMEHPAPAAPPAGKKRKVKKVIEVEEPAASLQLSPVVGPREAGLVAEMRF